MNNCNFTDLKSSLPEVSAFLPLKESDKIVQTIAKLYNVEYTKLENQIYSRVLTTPNHYAYLKIADGCNNFCSYCTIPFIRGRYVSTPMEQVISVAQSLVDNGAKEIILIAQDVTKYGIDIYNKLALVQLIHELSKIEKLEWIRLLYCYPDQITDELINEFKTNPKLCHYIDLPLQHISNTVLHNMNRKTNKAQIENIINKLRLACPDMVIRSTFILGFPGETEEQFEELCNWVKDYKLDNVGFFAYSREEGTLSYSMKNQIPERTKQKRLKLLSDVQYNVVIEKNNTQVGKTLRVLIDCIDNGIAVARYYGQCPDVDGQVFINNTNVKVGEFYNVKITNVNHYDLEGELV